MQSLNIKEWKLLELQITQTRHPKSVAAKRTDEVDPLVTRPAFSQGDAGARHVFRQGDAGKMQNYTDLS